MGDAVAAFIVDECGRYLMQHRDEIPGIFYPGFWSLFGGAVDHGESDREALQRELLEELGLDVGDIKPVHNFIFDLTDMGGQAHQRRYFELTVNSNEAQNFKLAEGQGFAFFEAPTLLSEHRVTPYDAFAVWIHYMDRFSRIKP
ncbi:MAG: NUDIX domain-containing protein [Rhodospirillales bacterium]|nr:NUDIX domain-containing protein [Rhodospirillales bacterium]MBO6786011.1 NUDIX domain-containing protein [Rhodospirillales bacterium]